MTNFNQIAINCKYIYRLSKHNNIVIRILWRCVKSLLFTKHFNRVDKSTVLIPTLPKLFTNRKTTTGDLITMKSTYIIQENHKTALFVNSIFLFLQK